MERHTGERRQLDVTPVHLQHSDTLQTSGRQTLRHRGPRTPELVLAVMTANYTLALSFQIVFLLMATKRRRSHPTSAKSLVKDTVSHPGRQLSNEIHSTSARPRFRKSQ